MKILYSFLLCFLSSMVFSQETNTDMKIPDKNKPIQIVETACGECKLGLPGESCDLAIRINGNAYFVDGTSIDDHGDAHAKDGFCNAIRKAEVQGSIVGDRFKATYFRLISEPSKTKETH